MAGLCLEGGHDVAPGYCGWWRGVGGNMRRRELFMASTVWFQRQLVALAAIRGLASYFGP